MANNGDDNNLHGLFMSSKPRPKPTPNIKDPITPIAGGDKSQTPQDFILLASKIASLPLQYSDPDVWGVLTAISTRDRQLRQGINMLLTGDDHIIGRAVADMRFQILSNQISQLHCKIYRKMVATEDADGRSTLFICGFLKDTSTNGTYLNWEKLNKNGPESKLHHGDIISLVAPPQHELAYAFVFREVLKHTSGTVESPLKRKADEFGSETKTRRRIGTGASQGPTSLDAFQSLQLSNMESRKQLEDQVATIDQLCNEHRAAIELHEVEKKNLKESISKTYLHELKEMHNLFEAKQKELVEADEITSELKHVIVDLTERLDASMQSRTEANEIMRSKDESISLLNWLLDEEKEQRKEDGEKAVANLTASIQRVKAEAQEELKRLSDASLRQKKEHQEIVNMLQESEKEKCLFVETLRSKLEDTRQKLVSSDNIESQLCQKVQELEHGISRLRKELESKNVSAPELEINAAMRKRIMLWETQLYAFYSTTRVISSLFAKQQGQLKSMQCTLVDEDNISVEINPNQMDSLRQSKEALRSLCSGGTRKQVSSLHLDRILRALKPRNLIKCSTLKLWL